MSLVDPTGRLITLTRDGAAVAALTPRVGGTDRRKGWTPPYVLVVPLAGAPGLLTGEGRRAGVVGWRHAFRCYGPKGKAEDAEVGAGDRQAEALALAVAASLDQAGPLTYPAPGNPSERAGIYKVLVEGIGPVLRDPTTQEPYVVVTTYTAAALRSFA